MTVRWWGGGGDRRIWPLRVLRARTKVPPREDALREARCARHRPGRARTDGAGRIGEAHDALARGLDREDRLERFRPGPSCSKPS
jgi:hypothetical protein